MVALNRTPHGPGPRSPAVTDRRRRARLLVGLCLTGGGTGAVLGIGPAVFDTAGLPALSVPIEAVLPAWLGGIGVSGVGLWLVTRAVDWPAPQRALAGPIAGLAWLAVWSIAWIAVAGLEPLAIGALGIAVGCLAVALGTFWSFRRDPLRTLGPT